MLRNINDNDSQKSRTETYIHEPAKNSTLMISGLAMQLEANKVKKRYKALIVDFDNTLVGPDLLVSACLSQSIQALLHNGYIFSLASGRRYTGPIEDICKNLGCTAPQIVLGGAEIIDPKTHETLWARYISDEVAKKLITFLSEQEIFVGYYNKNIIHTTAGKQIPFYEKTALYKDIDIAGIRNIPEIIIPASMNRFSEQYADSLIKTLNRKFPDIHMAKVTYKTFYGMDITSAKTTKHLALLELLKMLNLTKNEVVGVGDNYNDFPLLTACGVKVAMSDAPESLKNIADFIAPTEREDGLATVIEKYFGL